MTDRITFLLKGLESGWGAMLPFEKLLQGLMEDEAKWDEVTRRAFAPVATRLSEEEANWQPALDVHSIAEISNHMAYWLGYCVRLLRGESLEPLKLFPAAWEAPAGMPKYPGCLENLQRQYIALHDAVAALKEEELDCVVESPADELPRSILELVNNAITHNVYHVGQIRLLRRLWASRAKGVF